MTDGLAVRELNDRFRTSGPAPGWMITVGVEAMGPEFVALAVRAVQTFDAFDAGNDPHGEHDFGSFMLVGQQLFWKIDYYDLDYRTEAEDPGDPGVTNRVLIVMLASEY